MKHSNRISALHRKITGNQKLLFSLCVISLALPNVFLFFTERVPFVVGLCNVVLPVSVLWLIMTLNRRPGKIYLLMFPLVFFAAFQIVLLYLFGNSVIAVDMFLNLTTTNSIEAGELLSNIMYAIIFVAIVYIPLLLWSIYSLFQEPINDNFRIWNRKYAVTGCIIGAVLLVVSYATYDKFRVEDDLYPVNVLYNVGLAVDRTIKVKNYPDTSRDFEFAARSVREASEKEIHILLIGETARADNFGLYGYSRNTTPMLETVPNLVVFSDAMSQSNTTHKSVPMIMSAVSVENFNDIYHHKSIITAFKEAGYSTAFYSNQRPNHSFVDFFGAEAHDCRFVKKDMNANTNVSDDILIELLRTFIDDNDSMKKFIVLHSYGSHFDYSERYPANMSYFKPDKITSAKPENREILLNAYDNTIRATDAFIYRLIKMIEAERCVSTITYLSDHGEDIYDDDRNLFLHSSPIPTIYQLRVPFLIWTSTEYDSLYPEKRLALLKNVDKPVSSNLSAFHTIIDLAGIETRYFHAIRALSSEDYISDEPRLYLNDHNRPVSIEEIL